MTKTCKTLRIPCTTAWFNKVKNGEPDYRPVSQFWRKRIENRSYDTITFTLGYPKSTDRDKHFTIPFRGYSLTDCKTHYIINTQ